MVGVYVWDSKYRQFTYADAAATQQSGYQETELFELRISQLIDRTAWYCDRVASVLIGGAEQVTASPFYRRKGSDQLFPARAHHVLFRPPQGRDQILTYLCDVSLESHTEPVYSRVYAQLEMPMVRTQVASAEEAL